MNQPQTQGSTDRLCFTAGTQTSQRKCYTMVDSGMLTAIRATSIVEPRFRCCMQLQKRPIAVWGLDDGQVELARRCYCQSAESEWGPHWLYKHCQFMIHGALPHDVIATWTCCSYRAGSWWLLLEQYGDLTSGSIVVLREQRCWRLVLLHSARIFFVLTTT